MRRNFGGLLLGSAAFAQVFNYALNGQSGWSDPADGTHLGRLRVGNTYFNNPLAQHVGDFYRGLTGWAGNIKDDINGIPHQSNLNLILKIIEDHINPTLKGAISAASTAASPPYDQEKGSMGHVGSVLGDGLAGMLGLSDKMGFQQNTPISDMLSMGMTPSARAQEITDRQAIGRDIGMFQNSDNLPKDLSAQDHLMLSALPMQMEQKLKMFYRAASTAKTPEQQQYWQDQASQAFAAGIECPKPLQQYFGPVWHGSPSILMNIEKQYMSPAGAALTSGSMVQRAMIAQKLEQAQQGNTSGKGTNPYASLLPFSQEPSSQEDDSP